MRGIVPWLVALIACDSAYIAEEADGPSHGGKADVLGEDDRQPIGDSEDPRAREWARSVALLTTRVAPDGTGPEFVATLGESQRLCDGERFADAPVLGHCSSFLVAPDVVATAGHCFDVVSCSQTAVVFGFHDGGENADPLDLDRDLVFGCRDVILSPVEDAALVVLDRPVPGRKPFAIDTKAVSVGARLAMVGFPSGIPATVDTRGFVVRSEGTRLVTLLDSFKGHSGAVVLDTTTGKAVAVHVTGGQPNFVSVGSCNATATCPDEDVVADRCRGSGEVQIASLPFDAIVLPPDVDPLPPTNTSPPPAQCAGRCFAATEPGAPIHGCDCARDCSDRGTCCGDVDDACVHLEACSPEPDICAPGNDLDCFDAECTCASAGRFTETFAVDRPCQASGQCLPAQTACEAECGARGLEVASATTCDVL